VTTTINVMGGELGDIFWDLAPWVTYEPGYDMGCSIYVANPTDTEKEYALIARIEQADAVISEEALPISGYTWFKVEPGDVIKLKGALKFSETDVTLIVLLVERETQEVTDSVASCLVSPAAATSGWPIGWPGGAAIAPTDFSWLLPLMMFGMLGILIAPMLAPEEEEDRQEVMPAVEERKLLPPGRYE